MAKTDNLTDFLTDIANAIRTKKGTTDKINPQNFSHEIVNIPSGGEFDPTDGKERAINFFDTTGNLVYSYTRAEIKKLEELPEVPDLEGFTKSGWSSSLEELKSCQTFMDVAPIYSKNGGTANILVLEATANKQVTVGVLLPGTSYSIGIDWGDGSAEETKTGKSSSSSYSNGFTHTYTETGVYYVNIRKINERNAGYIKLGAMGYGSSNYPVVGLAFAGTLSIHRIYSIPYYGLLAINSPTIPIDILSEHYELKFVHAYTQRTSSSDWNSGVDAMYNCLFMFNPRLERIVGHVKENGTYFGYYCPSLKRLSTGFNVNATAPFQQSKEIEELYLTRLNPNWSTTLKTPLIAKRVVINDMKEIVIKLDSSTIVETDEVYVPDSLFEQYKADTSWQRCLDILKPISQYPDY